MVTGLVLVSAVVTSGVSVRAAPSTFKVYGKWQAFGPKYGMNGSIPDHGYIEAGLRVVCPDGSELAFGASREPGFIQFKSKSGRPVILNEKSAPRRVGIPFGDGRTIYRVDAGGPIWSAAVFLNPDGGARISMRAVAICAEV